MLEDALNQGVFRHLFAARIEVMLLILKTLAKVGDSCFLLLILFLYQNDGYYCKYRNFIAPAQVGTTV